MYWLLKGCHAQSELSGRVSIAPYLLLHIKVPVAKTELAAAAAGTQGSSSNSSAMRQRPHHQQAVAFPDQLLRSPHIPHDAPTAMDHMTAMDDTKNGSVAEGLLLTMHSMPEEHKQDQHVLSLLP